MIKNIILSLILLSAGMLTSCVIDPQALSQSDNSTINTDNVTGSSSFLTEAPPSFDGESVVINEEMLRPMPRSSYLTPYNYVVHNNFLIITDNGVIETFRDDSMTQVDPCTKAYYDNLTPSVFRHGDRIYITNRKQLNEFNRIYISEYGENKVKNTFVLARDIDLCSMTEPQFRPLGIQETGSASYFWATFDGDNHIVKNLYVKRDRYAGYDCAGFICGLAGKRESGRLQNIGISGRIEITADWSDSKNRGVGVVGWTTGGEIKNVVSNLSITAVRNVGGIVGMVATGESADGYAKPAIIQNVKNYADISGQANVGGIVGFAKNGNFANSSKAENTYRSIVNWGKIVANDRTTSGGLFGTYENHNANIPTLCKNGREPEDIYGKSTVQFNCSEQ